MLTFVSMKDELIEANRKKVWTNVTLRLDQKTKLKIIERANSEGLNTNQFLAKIVSRYLTDSSYVDNMEMHNALTDLLFKCQQRIGRLTADFTEVSNRLKTSQTESESFGVSFDSFVLTPPEVARQQAEEEILDEVKMIEKRFNPKDKEE